MVSPGEPESEIWDLLAGSAEAEKVPQVTAVAPASSVVGTSVAVVPAATEVVAKETKEVEKPKMAPPFKSRASASRLIPNEILKDEELNAAIAATLPRSHDFEVHRCVWKLRKAGARQVGLQMPEGLQGWATALADIFCTFVPSVESATIFGEANFGACDPLRSLLFGANRPDHCHHAVCACGGGSGCGALGGHRPLQLYT